MRMPASELQLQRQLKAKPIAQSAIVVVDKLAFGSIPSNLRVGDTIVWINRDLFRTAQRRRTISMWTFPPVPGDRRRLQIRNSSERHGKFAIKVLGEFSKSGTEDHGQARRTASASGKQGPVAHKKAKNDLRSKKAVTYGSARPVNVAALARAAWSRLTWFR